MDGKLNEGVATMDVELKLELDEEDEGRRGNGEHGDDKAGDDDGGLLGREDGGKRGSHGRWGLEVGEYEEKEGGGGGLV